jgi:hypothetical protein
MKAERSTPSVGLGFNHSTLAELIKTTDSLKYWRDLAVDRYNPHWHVRAARKVKRLEQKERLLRRILWP